jgi:hypothetical protein
VPRDGGKAFLDGGVDCFDFFAGGGDSGKASALRAASSTIQAVSKRFGATAAFRSLAAQGKDGIKARGSERQKELG